MSEPTEEEVAKWFESVDHLGCFTGPICSGIAGSGEGWADLEGTGWKEDIIQLYKSLTPKMAHERLDKGWNLGISSPLKDGEDNVDCETLDFFGIKRDACCFRHVPMSDHPEIFEDQWICNDAISEDGWMPPPHHWRRKDHAGN